MLSMIYKLKPNILFAMFHVGLLGAGVATIGFRMDQNQTIVTAAGVAAIITITNLAGKILEDDFDFEMPADEQPSFKTFGILDHLIAGIRPNAFIGMTWLSTLGLVISYIGSVWDEALGSTGNEALVAVTGVAAIVAVAVLAGQLTERESQLDLTRSFFAEIRPNIVLAITFVGLIGLGVGIIGFRMTNEAIVAAGGVGAIVAITNLTGKVLEMES